MVYTVGEMAKLLGVTASTLRYYDKEGLLPFVERSSGGIRMFQDSDFEWLQVIGCMKKAGMSIRDIRHGSMWKWLYRGMIPLRCGWPCFNGKNRFCLPKWNNYSIPRSEERR